MNAYGKAACLPVVLLKLIEMAKWKTFGMLPCDSGRLEIDDLGGWNGLEVELPKDDYILQALEDEEREHPLALRAVKAEVSASMGEEIGEVGIDAAALRIMDRKSIRSVLTEAELQEFDDVVRVGNAAMDRGCYDLRFAAHTSRFAVCSTGSDGSFAVLKLLDGKQSVGFVIAFSSEADLDQEAPDVANKPSAEELKARLFGPLLSHDIRQQLATQTGLTTAQVEKFLCAQAELAKEHAASGYYIEGIGRVVLMQSPARELRIRFGPDAGKTRVIPARSKVHFIISEIFRRAIKASNSQQPR